MTTEDLKPLDFNRLAKLTGEKYSPNLRKFFKWVKTHSKSFGSGHMYSDSVARGTNGFYFVFESEGHLHGYRVNSLMSGKSVTYRDFVFMNSDFSSIMASGRLKVVNNFQEEYEKIGRCFFDPDHTIYFLNSKNRYEPETLDHNYGIQYSAYEKCTWCGTLIGHRHKQVVKTVLQKDVLGVPNAS